MLGLEIFVHAVKMVLRNLKQALQISLLPGFVGAVIVIALTMLFGISFEDLTFETNALPDAAAPGAVFGFLLSFLIVLLTIMIWIIVSWHRFVLLEEYPNGFFPVFRSDRVLAYLGRLMMLVLLAIILSIPGGIILGLMSQASAVIGVLAWLAFVIFLTVAFYRVSPILPGAAIGHPIKLSDAWQATSGANGTIFLLVVLLMLFQLLLQFLAAVLLFIPVIGPVIVVFVSMLIMPLINVSVLTTIYGVFIEKRALS